MIKYSGSTIEEWFYSETPINKIYYNGRLTYLKLEAEKPDYKMIAQYSNGTSYSAECNGSTALTQSEVEAYSTPKSAMTKAYVYTCGSDTFKVGNDSFNGCTSLSSLTLDDKITALGNQSFMYCSGLTSFHFPSNLTSIEGSAFRYATKIKNINGIPSGVTYLSSGVFADMSGLTGATIPSTVTGSSTNLFLRDTALKEVHFKRRTAPALDADAFNGCTSLVKIYIPDCDCYNSYKAQSQFSGKTDLIYGEDGTKCKRDVYAYRIKRTSRNGSAYTLSCDSSSAATVSSAQTRTGLTAAQITGTSANQTPTSIIFGDCCKTIGYAACSGWTQLTSITISDSTTTIQNNALRGCVRVTSLKIGSGIKTISNSQSFYNMGTSASTKPDLDLSLNNGITISGNPFANTAFKNVKIPKNAKLYGGDTSSPFASSTITALSFGSGAEILEGESNTSGVFSLCKISSLNLDGVKTLGDFAFSRCRGFATANIPTSVTSMGSGVFSGCTSITKANVDCTGGLGSGAFLDCSSLSQVTIGTHVTSINGNAFRHTSIKSITIPDNVRSLGNNAFHDCKSLSSITLSNSLTKINQYLFANDSNLKNVVVPSGVTEIDKCAFSGCTNMGSLTVLPTTPPRLDYVDAVSTMVGTIYVPAASLNAYKNADGWDTQASRIKAIGT